MLNPVVMDLPKATAALVPSARISGRIVIVVIVGLAEIIDALVGIVGGIKICDGRELIRR